jgi:hypothetical protein
MEQRRQPDSVWAASSWPQSGNYEVTARLEMPHLKRWSVDKTTIVCLRDSRSSKIPIPVLSANNPFAKCAASNLVIDVPKLEYDIVCPESCQGACRLRVFSPHIVRLCRDGAKNMTMTEIQHGRRIGECSPRSPAEF